MKLKRWLIKKLWLSSGDVFDKIYRDGKRMSEKLNKTLQEQMEEAIRGGMTCYDDNYYYDELNDTAKACEEIARKNAIEFSEWMQENHWWKSNDSRFPLTVGRYTTAINGDVLFAQTKSIGELYVLFTESLLSQSNKNASK